MSSLSLLTIDKFLGPTARRLREHFEARLGDPLRAKPERFAWDWWHVPGQYTLLRTPAERFFPQPLMRAFSERLSAWGRRHLGCPALSPPWLSLYVEGCRQELHADQPHGPWAYVQSLTRWQGRDFKGGETLLLQEEILQHWTQPRAGRGLEEAGIFHEVPALFDRLTVFDPRIPHGVRRVEGTLDPLRGRLVLHGWFVPTSPEIRGPLPRRTLSKLIAQIADLCAIQEREQGPLQGFLSLEFVVGLRGTVGRIRVLSNTLRSTVGDAESSELLVELVKKFLAQARLGTQTKPSHVLLPLLMEWT